MKQTLVLLLISVIFFFNSEARQMNKCQIVQELRSHGFPENKMRDWVCLVQNESAGKTHKTGTVNKNGSQDHGLFQINDKYWCSNSGSPGKDCNVTCEDVKTDDITKAAECAKKIYKRHNFRAWYGWRNHCQGTLPDISDC